MRGGLRVTLFFALLVAAATFPLVNVLDPVLPDHPDAEFNVWRLSWVAHQLPRDPANLFDGNIFFPTPNTFAFSDAMLAVGVMGAPLIWMGVHPVVVHNLLVLAALVASGVAAWALCRELSGSGSAALVGGVIFSLAPYRFGHIAHLELQWAAFMPLTLLVLHRVAARAGATAWKHGLLAGVLLALQGLSSLYYAAFLGIVLIAWSVVMLAVGTRERGRLLQALIIAAITATVLLAPYLWQYAGTRESIGPRSHAEIQEFSAVWSDYLRVSSQNALYTPGPQALQDERSLFPGAAALALALAGLTLGQRRVRFLYAAITLLAVDLSLGANGWIYPLLLRAVPQLTSLRAPARFGILVMLGVGVLASLGAAAIARRLKGRTASAIVPLALAVMMVEYWSAPISTRIVPLEPSNVYRWLATQHDVVVLEQPTPTADTLWGAETYYELMSTYHWQPLVNGYSGFAPRSYFETLSILAARDPARVSERLQSLGVDYVVIHQTLLGPARFAEAFAFFSTLPIALPPQSFVDPIDPAVVIPLAPRR